MCVLMCANGLEMEALENSQTKGPCILYNLRLRFVIASNGVYWC